MAFNSILKFFIPKDKVFFQLFESVAESVTQMAEKLKEVFQEKEFSKREILIKEIEELGYRGVGKKYGVSDNSIRKWKKYYEK